MTNGQASHLTVTVAGQALSLPSAEIVEIIRVPACTRVPHGPPSLLGLANLRGVVLPVVSLAILLGQTPPDVTRRSRLVVLAGAAPIGLMVDDVTALATSSLGPPIDARGLLDRAFGVLKRHAAARHAEALPSFDEDQRATRDMLALIGLRVGGQHYALRLQQVAEIIRLPKKRAEVPRADEAMLGVTAFRGGLLPMVSLAALLGLKTSGAKDGAPIKRGSVIVVALGASWIGLVVDGVTGNFKVPLDAVEAVPRLLMRGLGETLLDGICRLEDGSRLVGLLAVDRLFDAQTLASLQEAGSHEKFQMAQPTATTTLEQFVLFRSGGEHYGLPIAAVDEIVSQPKSLTGVPHTPAFILGMLSLRGHAIPVIDMAERFGNKAAADQKRRVIVVSANGLKAGLAVDAVCDVLSVPHESLRAALPFTPGTEALFDRIALQHEGRMVLLVSPGTVVAQAEREVAAQKRARLPALS